MGRCGRTTRHQQAPSQRPSPEAPLTPTHTRPPLTTQSSIHHPRARQDAKQEAFGSIGVRSCQPPLRSLLTSVCACKLPRPTSTQSSYKRASRSRLLEWRESTSHQRVLRIRATMSLRECPLEAESGISRAPPTRVLVRRDGLQLEGRGSDRKRVARLHDCRRSGECLAIEPRAVPAQGGASMARACGVMTARTCWIENQ